MWNLTENPILFQNFLKMSWRAIGAYAFAVWPATEGHRSEMVKSLPKIRSYDRASCRSRGDRVTDGIASMGYDYERILFSIE